jgi:uncharacterized membrane protein YfcA
MILGLICFSIIAWFLSTLAGGGSSLILIPIIGFFLTSIAIPPVITIGAIFGNSERAIAYREKINWRVIRWELPGALVGACLGAFTLTKINLEWLTLLIAFFLFISGINYLIALLKNKKKSFTVHAWYFLPLGFIYAFLSGIIGSTVPFLTPFYLNYGLEKEELLGTQAVNRASIHLVKIVAYTMFGVLTLPYLGYGLVIGLASLPGNWLGHITLQKISEQRFRQLVTSFVMITSMLMIWQQRNLLIFLIINN